MEKIVRKITYFLFYFLFFAFSVQAENRQEELCIHENSVLCNNFLGVGIQWSAYPHADSDDAEWGLLMTDKKWEMLYKRLDYMQPRFARVFDMPNWRYFKKLDANGVPVLDFNTQEVKSLFKLLDYCQKNDITVMIGNSDVPGIFHDTNNPGIRLKSAIDMRLIKMIGEWVDFLLNEKAYTCIKYFDFINEPNGSWTTTQGNFAEWALGVKLLFNEFVNRGLDKKIQIAGPGTAPNFQVKSVKDKYEGPKWVEYTSEILNKEVGAYNTHAYLRHSVIREGKAADFIHMQQDVAIADKDNKPFFLGEIGIKIPQNDPLKVEHEKRRLADGHASTDCNMFIYDHFYGIDMASAAIQSMLAGVDGMAAWDLDDAMHTEGDLGDKTKLKRWGFWNILGTELHNNPADENIRPWYYPWSWLCRYMPLNTVLVNIDQPANKGCQALVARYQSHYTIYLVNTSDVNEKIRIKLEGDKMLDFNKLTYNEQYTKSDKPYKEEKLKKINMEKGLNIELPSKTFITLTTMNY